MDAAHLLPLLGVVLVILPLLRDPAQTPESETAGGMIYLFVVWILLILAALGISYFLTSEHDPISEAKSEDDEGA